MITTNRGYLWSFENEQRQAITMSEQLQKQIEKCRKRENRYS